jgi:hypothetical protein
LIDKRGRPIVVGEGLGKRVKTSALILARYLRPH